MEERYRCPFCLERTGSLGNNPFGKHLSVNTESGKFFCHRCNASGVADDVVRDRYSFNLRLSDSGSVVDRELSVPHGFVPLYPVEVQARSPILRKHILRALTSSQGNRRPCPSYAIDRLRVGVVLGEKGRGEWTNGALVYPSCDPENPGYTLRTLSGQHRAYVSRRDGAIHRAEVLSVRTDKPIWVGEGVNDALCLGSRGISLYGKGVTEAQIDRLARCRSSIGVAFDGDAWQEGEVLVYRLALRGVLSVFWVRLPAGKDPGELGFSVVSALGRHYV